MFKLLMSCFAAGEMMWIIDVSLRRILSPKIVKKYFAAAFVENTAGYKRFNTDWIVDDSGIDWYM
jgi:hypothetical protein